MSTDAEREAMAGIGLGLHGLADRLESGVGDTSIPGRLREAADVIDALLAELEDIESENWNAGIERDLLT